MVVEIVVKNEVRSAMEYKIALAIVVIIFFYFYGASKYDKGIQVGTVLGYTKCLLDLKSAKMIDNNIEMSLSDKQTEETKDVGTKTEDS